MTAAAASKMAAARETQQRLPAAASQKNGENVKK